MDTLANKVYLMETENKLLSSRWENRTARIHILEQQLRTAELSLQIATGRMESYRESLQNKTTILDCITEAEPGDVNKYIAIYKAMSKL